MKFLFTSVALTLIFASFAQQDPLITQFWNNYVHTNPAVSGLYYKHQAAVSYRNQWSEINGAPNTVSANYNVKIDKLHGGMGITYQLDDIGYIRQNNAYLSYSYHLKLGENATLAAGIGAGIVHMKMRGGWIAPTNPQNPSLQQLNGSGAAFDLKGGLVFKTKKLSVGVSSTRLTEPTIRDVSFTFSRNYFLFADYTFNIGDNFSLKPQLLLRTNSQFYTTDINLLAYYKNKFWAGATYRTSDAFALMAGWDIKEKYRIGYSYDVTYSKLNNGVYGGSHEIVLGFMLK